MKKIPFLLLLLALAAGMRAQELLTLEQCREMALRHNKELAASGKQRLYADYMQKSVRANFLPNISASGTGLYSNADGSFGVAGGNLPVLTPDLATGQFIPNGNYAYFPGLNLDYKVGTLYTAGISLEQPLYMGGKIRAAYRVASLSREMARLNEALTTTEVLLKTDEAFANVVKARELKSVAEKYNTLLKTLLRDVKNARRHGLTAKNDVMKVQVRLNESELSLRRADNGLRLATMNLCHCIGRPLLSSVEVSGDLPSVPELDTRQSDITGRPEYAILQKQTDIAHQQVKLSRSEMLPQVGIRGSYNYLHGLEVNNETLLDKGSFSVMLNVTLPLFHFGERSNKVRAARMKLEQTRLEQENLNEQMQLQLMQAANNLDEARLELTLARQSLTQADENMRISRKQYDAGLETLSDHLEAQVLWQQAYQQQVESAYALYLRYVEYRKAAGME